MTSTSQRSSKETILPVTGSFVRHRSQITAHKPYVHKRSEYKLNTPTRKKHNALVFEYAIVVVPSKQNLRLSTFALSLSTC